MRYALESVSDGLFIDELQDSIYNGGVEIGAVALKFNVDEDRVTKWLLGDDLPCQTVQHAVLNWLAAIVI